MSERTFFRLTKRQGLLGLGILLSLLFHLILLTVLKEKPRIPAHNEQVPVKLNITEKKKKTAQVQDKQIIEAPQIPTEAPEDATKLGPQDHKARQETKLQPKMSIKGAPSSPIQNGPIKFERSIPDNKGTIRVPSQKKLGYAQLLPMEGEALNLAHNDYIPDKNIPTGGVLDVNTTDFRFIAYFSAVRKLVEMAFTDIGPTLRSSPYVQQRLTDAGKVSFQGSSKIQLKVERSGLLTEAKLVDSSGDRDIDAFWEKILNVAAPYPPLPKAYPEDQLVFTYTLHYDIVMKNEGRVPRFLY
jgi:outer membrane biosynthesis protein TonB